MDDNSSDTGGEEIHTDGLGLSPVHISRVLAPIYISTCPLSSPRTAPSCSPAAQGVKGDHHLPGPPRYNCLPVPSCWSLTNGRPGMAHHHQQPPPRRCTSGRAAPVCQTHSPPAHTLSLGDAHSAGHDALPSLSPSKAQPTPSGGAPWPAVQERMALDQALHHTIAADIAAIRASMQALEVKALAMSHVPATPSSAAAALEPLGLPQGLQPTGELHGPHSPSDSHKGEEQALLSLSGRPEGSPGRGREPPHTSSGNGVAVSPKTTFAGATPSGPRPRDSPLPASAVWSPTKDGSHGSPKTVQFNSLPSGTMHIPSITVEEEGTTFASLVLRDAAHDADFRRKFESFLVGVWSLGSRGDLDVRQQLTSPIDDDAYAALLRRIHEAAEPTERATKDLKDVNLNVNRSPARGRRNSYTTTGTLKEMTRLQEAARGPFDGWSFGMESPDGAAGRRARIDFPPRLVAADLEVPLVTQTRRHTICAPMQSPHAERPKRDACALWALVRQALTMKCFAVLQLCEQLTKFVDDFIYNVYSHFLVKAEPLTVQMPAVLHSAFREEFAGALHGWGMLEQVEGQLAIQKPRLSMVLLRYELTSWRIGICKPLLDAQRRLAHTPVKRFPDGSPPHECPPEPDDPSADDPEDEAAAQQR
eukprot:GGOE01006957.1.p1 GENE.GGOE01006957.1~~GGOE01006957.1.p1  ORF type:complete len:646 (-),score=125.78 GGOE01006957.1:755-2692(-)